MTGPGIEVRDETDRKAYVITVDGEEAGRSDYRMRDGRHVFVHTEIDPSRSGLGLATHLIRHALDDVRAAGGQIVPLCPFVAAFVAEHPDYEELVDREMTARYRARSAT